jgi:hypothetical protein
MHVIKRKEREREKKKQRIGTDGHEKKNWLCATVLTITRKKKESDIGDSMVVIQK